MVLYLGGAVMSTEENYIALLEQNIELLKQIVEQKDQQIEVLKKICKQLETR